MLLLLLDRVGRRMRDSAPAELDLHHRALHLGRATTSRLLSVDDDHLVVGRHRRDATDDGRCRRTVVTSTRRSTARRQCRASVSGRSTPGEVTSSTKGPGRASDSGGVVEELGGRRLTAATRSRSTPPSRSTTMRTTWRRPAFWTSTASRSTPSSASGSDQARLQRVAGCAMVVLLGSCCGRSSCGRAVRTALYPLRAILGTCPTPGSRA